MPEALHIEIEAAHEAALNRINELMDSDPGTEGGRELDALVEAVEEYESRTVEIGYPEPLAIIEFRMEQSGLRPDDLIPCLGSKEAVAEVLSGRQPITLAVAHALEGRLGIPVEVLHPVPASPRDEQSLSRF